MIIENLHNPLDKIYATEPHASFNGYRCSVCRKDFKTVAGAQRHFQKRSCHKMADIFEGTNGEEVIYGIYLKLCEAEKRYPFKLENLRGKRFYTIIAKFLLYCITNGVANYQEYLWFVIQDRKPDELIKAVSWATNERALQKYRQWKIYNIGKEQSEAYYDQYRPLMTTDPEFVMRSFEKGELSPYVYFERVDMTDFLDVLSPAQRKRFEDHLLKIEVSDE